MRTNIEIDVRLMKKALKVSRLPTKRAAVEEGLRLLIRRGEQAGVRELFGKVPLAINLNETRRGRHT